MANLTRDERLAVFLERLGLVPAASTAQEAFELVGTTLNDLEDELTDIPYQPGNHESDGRMYPPQEDSSRDVPGRSDVVRYRNRGHSTFVRDNGAIEIQDLAGKVVFSKLGRDGVGVALGGK